MLKEDNLNKNYKSIANFIKTFEIDQNGQKLTPLEIMVQENVVNGKILREIACNLIFYFLKNHLLLEV